MTDPTSRVSVIIPCYGYGKFLPACLASVLAQEAVDLEVLILDDASPDDTPDVAAALAATDPRIEFRRHSANQGHLATFNDGLAWASGEYIVIISADDLLTDGALARAARLLEAHPQVGLVYGTTVPFISGQSLPPARTPRGPGQWRITPGRQWFETACRRASTGIWTPEVMVRASVQREVGGYRTDLPHTADQYMWLEFALHADVGWIGNADQAYYRYHPHNLHKTLAPTRYLDLLYRRAAFTALFQAYADQLPEAASLQQIVTRRVARSALGAAGAVSSEGADGRAQSAELIAFALQLYPAARATPEYLGLQLARLCGPRILPLLRAGHRRFFQL